jgi:hypothetical protein
MHSRLSLSILFSAAAFASARAQSAPANLPPSADTPVALSNFVVTATRSAVAIADLPSRVEVVTATELAAEPGPYLTTNARSCSSMDARPA